MKHSTRILLSILFFFVVCNGQPVFNVEERHDGTGWKLCKYPFDSVDRSKLIKAMDHYEGWKEALVGLTDEPLYCQYWNKLQFHKNEYDRYHAPPGDTRSDLYALHGTATFTVDSDQTATWLLCGDDGVVLIIDGVPVGPQGGYKLQAMKCYEFETELTAGGHTIEVAMFENHGATALVLNCGPGWTPETCDISTSTGFEGNQAPPVTGLCYKGSKYFTLDEVSAASTEGHCQTNAVTLPLGATLAPNDLTTGALVESSRFGTDCVVLGDGVSVKTSAAITATAVDITVSLPTNDGDDVQVTKKSSMPAGAERDISAVEWSVQLKEHSFDHPAFTSELVYEVTVLGDDAFSGANDLSHWTLGIGPTCNVISTSCDSCSGGFLAYGLDADTGLPGLQYDSQLTKGSTYTISITVEGLHQNVAEVNYAVAGTDYFAVGETMGYRCGHNPASRVNTHVLVADTTCGSDKLIGDNQIGYSADCSDSVHRRVLAKKDGCDAGDIDIADHAITNYVVLNGMRYATLDDARPDGESNDGCGSNVGVLPSGWTIAPFNSETALLNLFGGSTNKFGTTCMIFADGKGRSNVFGSLNEICATDAIQSTAVLGEALIKVFNHWCPGRIVITQAAAADETNSYELEHTGDLNYTPGVAGFNYGTADNSATNGPIGCQPQPYALPSGWEIAPSMSSVLAQMLRHYNMETSCVVTGDGVSTATGAFGGDCGENMLISHEHDGKTFLSVNACDARVLIRKAEVFDESSLGETCGVCTGWGDPHLTTFDGVRYDSYGSEAVLKVVELTTGMDPCTTYSQPAWKCNFGVYAWQVPLHRVATNKAVLVKYTSESGVEESIQVIVDHTIKLRSNVPVLKINQAVTALEIGDAAITMAGGAVVTRVSGRRNRPAYRIELPNGIRVEVTPGFYKQPLMDYVVRLPKLFRGSHTVHGLCGDCDGTQTNDFYNPIDEVVVDRNTITGSRKERKAKIQNDFVNKNVVSGPNPFDEDVVVPSPVPVAPDEPEVCDEVSQRVLDQVDVCCKDLENEEYDLCRDEVCINKGCDSMETLKDVTDALDEVITNEKPDDVTCEVASPFRQSTLAPHHGGRIYSSVDGANGYGVEGVRYFAIPEGWRIAERDELALANIGCTDDIYLGDCIVFADGTGVSRDGTYSSCGSNLILRTGEGGKCVRPVSSGMAILLVKNVDSQIMDTMDNSCFQGEGCFWYREQGSDVLEYPAEEDPSGGQVVTVVSSNMYEVNGLHRTWELGGLGINALTMPMSATVWAKTSEISICDDNEAYYIQTDLYLNDESVMSFRTRDFSSNYQYEEYLNEYNCRTASHGWERVVVDLNFRKMYSLYQKGNSEATVTRITMHLVVKGAVGSVTFGVPRFDIAKPESYNFVNNGGFNQPLEQSAYAGNSFRGWVVKSGNIERTEESSVSGLGEHPEGRSGSLKLSGSGSNHAATMKYWGVPGSYTGTGTADETYHWDYSPTQTVCVWHKADNLIGTERAGSSVYIDFLGESENSYGKVLTTKTGTTGWYQICKSFSLLSSNPYNRMAIQAQMNDAGQFSASYFDGITALPTCHQMGSVSLEAVAYGDPHYVTMDGVKYDAQNIGEYRLYEDSTMRVQHRHSRAGGAAVISAVAAQHFLSGFRVQIDRPAQNQLEPTVFVNGVKIGNLPKYSAKNNLGSLRLTRSGYLSAADAGHGSVLRYHIVFFGTYISVDENGEEASIAVETIMKVSVHNTIYGTSFLQVGFTRPANLINNTPRGLLGAEKNGNPSDDFLLPDGTAIDYTDEDAIKQFAEAWRVKSDKASIFVYPRGENFANYYDPTFEPTDLSAFTEEELFAAATTCREAGVSANDMSGCVFDVVAGGEGYVVASSAMSSEFSTADAPGFDDVIPPELVGETTDESTTTRSAIGWTIIASILGSFVFTSFGCCVLFGCFGVVGLRLLRVAGWTMVNREERKAMLPTHMKHSEKQAVDEPAEPSAIKRQLSNAVDFLAELLASEEPKATRYISLQAAEEGRDVSGGESDQADDGAPSMGRSATAHPLVNVTAPEYGQLDKSSSKARHVSATY